jgi:phosphate transport system substrate-binding protein
MQRQKSIALIALTAVVAAMIAFGSTAQSLAAQATAAATMAGTAAPATPIPGSGLITAGVDGEAKALTGIGATFPYALYTKWFSEYAKVTGVQVSYPDKQGSGKGLAAIADGSADFGASDAFPGASDAVTPKVKSGDVLVVPMTLGAVVLVYNLPNFKDTLKLTPDTLAGIYLGKITKWNDAALVADNPGLKDVTDAITPVHRADSSGTTNIFTSYLSAVNSDWKSGPGISKDLGTKWPVAGLSDNGNSGVQGKVASKTGAIGYVELFYAIGAKLSFAQLKNQAGNFVTPSTDSVTAAAAGLKDLPADLNLNILNQPAADAYPISAPTWQLVYKDQKAADKGLALARLLWWELHDGQAFSSSLGYAPLPYSVIQQAEQKVLSITVDGKQALPTSIATPNPVMAATAAPTKSS